MPTAFHCVPSTPSSRSPTSGIPPGEGLPTEEPAATNHRRAHPGLSAPSPESLRSSTSPASGEEGLGLLAGLMQHTLKSERVSQRQFGLTHDRTSLIVRCPVGPRLPKLRLWGKVVVGAWGIVQFELDAVPFEIGNGFVENDPALARHAADHSTGG